MRIHAAARAHGGGRILLRWRKGAVPEPSVRTQDVRRGLRLSGAFEGGADGVEGRGRADRLAGRRACAFPRAARVSGRGLAGGDAQDRDAGGGRRRGGGRSAEARVRRGRSRGRCGGARHRGAPSGARQRVRESGFGGRVPGGVPSGLHRASPSGDPAHPPHRRRRQRHLLRGGAVGLEHHRHLPFSREGARARIVASRDGAHGAFAELERREHDDERHPCAAAGRLGFRGVPSAADCGRDAARPVRPPPRSAAARRGGDAGRARLPPAVRDRDSVRRIAERALCGGGTARPFEEDDGRGAGHRTGVACAPEDAGCGERVDRAGGRSVARRRRIRDQDRARPADGARRMPRRHLRRP